MTKVSESASSCACLYVPIWNLVGERSRVSGALAILSKHWKHSGGKIKACILISYTFHSSFFNATCLPLGSLVQLSQYLAEMFVPLGNDCCACQGYSKQWQHHSNTWTARKVWSQAINYTVGLFCSVKRIIACEETAILCTYNWFEGKDTPNKESNTDRLRKGCPLFCRKHTKFFGREKRRH